MELKLIKDNKKSEINENILEMIKPENNREQ